MGLALKVLDVFLSLITTLLILLALPLGILFMSIILVWRQIVQLLSWTFKDFESMASGQDMLFMMDNVLEKPHSAIPLVYLFDYNVSPGQVEKRFQELFDTKRSDYEEKFEKLKLYPVRWLGFCFWSRDLNFSLKNHISLITKSRMSSKTLTTFVEKIIRKSFKANQSPWEVLLYPYFEDDQCKTVVMIRIHHTLMDGKSMVKFMKKFLRDPNEKEVPLERFKKEIRIKKNWREKCAFWLNILIRGPLIYFKELVEMRDTNCIQNAGEIKKSGEWLCSITDAFSFEKVRKAKNIFRSAVTAVAVAAISGALRKYICKYYSDEEVPDLIHAISSIALPNHPDDKLTNHLTAVSLEWPVKEENPRQRIIQATKSLAEKSSSMFPIFSPLLFSLVGVMPLCFIETATSFKSATILFTNIQGLESNNTLAGIPLTKAFFWLPPTREATAISIGISSYDDNMHVSVVSDKVYFGSKQRLEELTTLIYEEFIQIINDAEEIEAKLK